MSEKKNPEDVLLQATDETNGGIKLQVKETRKLCKIADKGRMHNHEICFTRNRKIMESAAVKSHPDTLTLYIKILGPAVLY